MINFIYNKSSLLVMSCLLFFNLPHSYAQDNNSLFVGTTGDYPPLTKDTESGFVGRDIDLINRFALDNKLKIKFVKTTWQNLSSDLQNNKFSVAVGGISYNAKRAQLFYISTPIESSAKVAMIRCSDNYRFNSYADIDQESIIIIENRGGTNQDFALEHIKNATLKIVSKNESAINSLTVKPYQSDVMFTDNTEVAYRHQIMPDLCQAYIRETFPSSPKVFLFSKTPYGNDLQIKFNSWLVKNQQLDN